MSKLTELKSQIHTIGEIETILSAMKNLAVIELNKVSRLAQAQERAAETLTAALADFEAFYLKEATPPKQELLVLLIGSERGFCGPFNEHIIAEFQKLPTAPSALVTVGRKLAAKLNTAEAISLPGPNSAEEIQQVIQTLAAELFPYAGYRWLFLYNSSRDAKFPLRKAFPLEARKRGTKSLSRPLLTMPPEELHPQLLEQYLFSVLQEALYDSFATENRDRLRHMDGALRRIEEKENRLQLKANSQRQEVITEEIEILLLNENVTTADEML